MTTETSRSFALPTSAEKRSLAAYIHIPFCAARCGYCDFNTYTHTDFGGGASLATFAQTICSEIEASAALLGEVEPLTSVFFGGGTPTMLPPADVIDILNQLRRIFTIADGTEVTIEANPESVTPASLAELRAGGFNRISFGMQSAAPHILATLQRAHTPGNVRAAALAARELGFDYSLDLIYGTPGESMDDWEESVSAAIDLQPQHISAYALSVEPHTPMGRAIARGELSWPDPDDQADKYERVDDMLRVAGYEWYEISNWAQPGHESRHNVNYWKNGNWWGYGPGAHSHIDGMRWWNLKHPVAYAKALVEQKLPAADCEYLTPQEIREEYLLMGIRLRTGIDIPSGTDPQKLDELIADGLIDSDAAHRGRVRLTRTGRLLADVVTRALW